MVRAQELNLFNSSTKEKVSIFIISGPSGSGKTTIMGIVEKTLNKDVARVITCTTRERRPGEIHGIDYFFLTEEEFDEGVSLNEFIEVNTIYKNRYGCRYKDISTVIKSGFFPLLCVDVEGADKIKKSKLLESIGNPYYIFVYVSDKSELELRLKGRGELNIHDRILRYEHEMKFKDLSDFSVDNEDINDSSRAVVGFIEKVAFQQKKVDDV